MDGFLGRRVVDGILFPNLLFFDMAENRLTHARPPGRSGNSFLFRSLLTDSIIWCIIQSVFCMVL